jgi:adenosylhomocysteine nucleosidase
VVETGIGSERTRNALQWILGKPFLGNVPYLPKIVIAAGFSGALQEGYRIGDIILATEVTDLDGNCRPATWPLELPPGEWRPPLHQGRLLSVSTLITNPEEKRALGEKHQALAVDMETAMVAQMCSSKGVPFGCVRAISDTVDSALSPQLVHLFSDGRISLVKVLRTIFRQPHLTGELLQLARNTRHAARQLAAALGELLTLTLPWTAG